MTPFELRTSILEIELELMKIRQRGILCKILNIIKVYNLIKLKEDYQNKLDELHK